MARQRSRVDRHQSLDLEQHMVVHDDDLDALERGQIEMDDRLTRIERLLYGNILIALAVLGDRILGIGDWLTR